MSDLAPFFMMPGGFELVIIFMVVVLLFGAAKVPKLARAAGESMGEFQKGRQQVERELVELREQSALEPDVETDPEPESASLPRISSPPSR